MKFKPVDLKVDFSAMEKRLLDWWYKSGVVEKYLKKNEKSKKTFSFIDGPITANNPMGVHHAWGRTYKDLWQRYKNMEGYAGRFQNGFDCQGLWVEVEVEKELGFKSKKDIEKFGIAKFVSLCKKRAEKFAQVQTEQSKRLGYFMNWDNSYFTMSDENNYMIWYFLKKCFEKKWLYKGKDSVPWCPRCGTAISQHEMLTEDYKEVKHKSVYFKLPITTSGWTDCSFLVWTTTPWTIPANVCLVVDPKKDYLIVKEGNSKLILSKKRAVVIISDIKKKKTKTVKGKDLLGLKYRSLFDHLERVKNSLGKFKHQVFSSDPIILPVDESEGTGIVHVATGAGSEDYKLGKKKGLPVIDIIDEEANYLDGLDEFSFKNAKDKPELILDFVEKKDKGKYFYKTEVISHRYPACWRCKKELVWRAVDEWYIKMDKKDSGDKTKRTLRKEMINVAKNIKWIPDFGLKRELDWLKNMDDWLISKKRYWGLALPIWECECGHFEVIGSKDELKKKAVQGWSEFSGHTPHRPWIDKIKIKCPQCSKLVSRIPDVGNPWLDAGIVGFSTLIDPELKKVSYTADKKYFNRWFPADFITESFPGQFKNWFYSMIAMSTVLEKKPSYKTVLGFATLLAEDGRPMHKSWGNAIEFNKGADKIGVDVMRWMYISHDPQKNLLFGYKVADETRRRFHLTLWNTYNFFVTFANLNNWFPKDTVKSKLTVLDEWLLLKLNILIKKVSQSLDSYDPYLAAKEIEEFVRDFSTWYIRRSRERVSLKTENEVDKKTCLTVLRKVLLTLCRLLAPFTPFMVEEIFKNISNKESVHLESWPQTKLKILTQAEKNLIKGMSLVREICELGHSQRKKAGIKVRHPLQSIEVKIDDVKLLNKSLEELIKDELNIKEVKTLKSKELRVILNTKINPELQKEGQARDLIRQIQNARKNAKCGLDQLITVYLPSWPEEFEKEIMRKTLVKSFKKGKELKIV
ncbi:isoleucine--tRNA ligase [Candidatus Beckwithbacteria bacterium CG10_big_fil_rev_8_21_14_0_10_34_10]|uniref:Isoleucine--tRNA ligase n=1 Tax=Candidatus Beckwithbacteria bacterium CG10_big_fil_rev_8_21_14_0_10_34_10 TaxID=1974495 RepID=A0A2H0WCE7_9BACT|nr:MAG: isoleucine--tRNA ligase [Candidatus Beckwithbacteria bacterium CG10_big_fil_rev_8_21_14_0_10_34_10]